MVVALLVVGPDKLPGLAKTLAGYVVELKKAANSLKQSLDEEEELRPWDQPPRDFTLPEGFEDATVIAPETDDGDGEEEETGAADDGELSDAEEENGGDHGDDYAVKKAPEGGDER